MNKIYYDAEKNLEVVDVSGVKDIEQLEKDYNAKLIDVTDERNAKIETEKQEAEKGDEQKKIKKLSAIAKLKALGLTEEEINTL